MEQAHTRMKECFNAAYCSLHVRYTNVAAFHLYSQTLEYKVHKLDEGYYADGEDAYDMRCNFREYDEAEDLAADTNKLSIKDEKKTENTNAASSSSKNETQTTNVEDNQEAKSKSSNSKKNKKKKK